MRCHLRLPVNGGGTGLIWQGLPLGEELAVYTSPPLQPSGKRIQLLVPVGWRARQDDNFRMIGFEMAEKPYPWLRHSRIREWLKLDAEDDQRLVLYYGLLPVQYFLYPHVELGKPFRLVDEWLIGWNIRADKHVFWCLYGRKAEHAFETTYRRIMESAK